MLETPASYPHERRDSMLYAALSLVDQGFSVFPCGSNKMPSRPKAKGGQGFHDATRDPKELRWLWAEWPGKLIGVRTGEASNLDVLDIDMQHEEADEWYGQRCTELHHFRTHTTRSGGLHILFRHRPGMTNSAGRVAKHVDVRGEGGYIIHWPSAGQHILNENTALTEWPEWLATLAQKPEPAPIPHEPMPPMKFNDRYVEKAVENAVRRVATMGEGSRNETLNKETYSLLRFVQEGRISASVIAEVMTMAALSAGLNEREVRNTIASALRGRAVA